MKDFIGRTLRNVIETTKDAIERHAGSPGAPQRSPPAETHEDQDSEDVGADSVLQRMLRRVRSHEVRSHVLNAPPSKYVRRHSVRLQALTYNVNGKRPPPGLSLEGWLDPGEGEQAVDIVAVAFQELVPLNAGNVITGGEDREAAAAWVQLIGAALNGDTAPERPREYVCMAERQLVGVYLTVWAHARVLPHIRGVQVATVATGFAGVLANKGAVAVRLRVYDTGLCIVACHLASGESAGAAAGRLRDFSDILRRAEFPAEGAEPAPRGSEGAAEGGRSSLVVGRGSQGDWGLAAGLLSSCHHHIVFMGDMNFRVAVSHAEAIRLIGEGRLDELQKSDGLRLARATEEGSQLLAGWREGHICFAPTYKFRIGTDEYAGATPKPSSASLDELNASQSDVADDAEFDDGDAKQEKIRTPSWTDRILWRSALPGLQQVSYRSGPQTVSDHRPVSAAFLLHAREFDLDELAQLVEEGWHELDLAVMAAMPRCDLQPRLIDFGNVEVGMPSTRTAVLKNLGSTAAHFRFIETPGLLADSPSGTPLSKVTPPWLKIDPMEGVVEEGSEIDIRLSVDVFGGPSGCAHYVVQQLDRSLEQVLVLHIAGGSDFFVALNGFLMPSVFGVPLESLPSSSEEEGSIPMALLELTDFLLANGRLRTPGIFLGPAPIADAPASLLDSDVSPPENRLPALRRALSSGQGVPDNTDPLDAAATLLQLFAELPQPFLPQPATTITDVCVPSHQASLGILKEGMSTTHWAVFVHTVELMRNGLAAEVAAESGLTHSAVSMLLADVWFPPLPQRFGWVGGAARSPTDVSAIDAMQLVADSTAAIQQRRADFVALFLADEI